MNGLEGFKRKLKEYLQVQYEQGTRWFERAKEIGNFLVKGSQEGIVFTGEACDFISKAENWSDLLRRMNVLFDPPQQAPKAPGQNITGVELWLYKNKEVQKSLAQTCIRLINTVGFPKDQKEWSQLKSIFSIAFGIIAEKERIVPAGEEEITEEIPVETGWWIFKKKSVEKRIIKKPKQAIIKDKISPQELIGQLARFE